MPELIRYLRMREGRVIYFTTYKVCISCSGFSIIDQFLQIYNIHRKGRITDDGFYFMWGVKPEREFLVDGFLEECHKR